MSLGDQLHQLDELRQRGALTEEEFARAKARLIDEPAAPYASTYSSPPVAAVNGFRRSRSDAWLGGVCGGIGRSTGVESWVWRLVFAIVFFFGGIGLLAYLLLWIFVPAE